MSRLAASVGALALVLAGCSDDGGPAETAPTEVTVTLGEPLPVGASYQDPSGNVTLTVRGVRISGGLLFADAEACAADDGLPALPIQGAAWQLRIAGRAQSVERITVDEPPRAGRPPWPDDVQVRAGECVEGKVAFRIPDGTRPAEILFTQLGAPVSWRVRT